MKNKFVLISVVLLVVILLSSCGAIATPGSQANQTSPRILTISGAGKVTLKPDIATINVGVHTEKPGAAEAVTENNANTQKLIDALKASGVDQKDIQTMNYSIWQNTQYSPDGKPSSTNYAVDNTVYLTVRNLSQLGDLLDTAVKAGANNINGIQFDVADKTSALSAARAEAVKNAKQQAEELATAAGVTLGAVQSIQYTDNSPSPISMGKGMDGNAMAANVAVPINPGRLDITVSVSMSFEIK